MGQFVRLVLRRGFGLPLPRAVKAPFSPAGGHLLIGRRHYVFHQRRRDFSGIGSALASFRRLILAVTGSSADNARVPSARGGLDAVLPQRLDLRGQLGTGRASSLPGPGEPGLELVAQGGQLVQVAGVGEGLADPGLVVAELGFSDLQILPGAVAFEARSLGQPLDGVQHGPRPLVLAGKPVCGVTAPSRYTSGVMRMQDHAERGRGRCRAARGGPA